MGVSRFRPRALTIGAIALAVLGMLGIMVLDARRSAWWAFAVTQALGLAVVVSLFRGAGMTHGRERRAWRTMATGLGFILPSNVLLIAGQMGGGESFADAGLGMAVVAMTIVGLGAFMLPRDEVGSLERARLLFDSLVGGLATGLAMWWVVTELVEREVSTLPTLFISSVLISVAALLLGRRSTTTIDRPTAFLTLAVVFVAIGDVIGAVNETPYRFGTAADVGYILSQLALIFMAEHVALQGSGAGPVRKVRPISWRNATRISLSPVAMLPLLVIGRAGAEPFFRAGVVLVTALLVIRQMIAVKEQRDRLKLDHSGMVATIAHELRTPLTAVFGALVMLEEHDVSDDLRDELITTARSQAEVLSRVVGDLVSLARDTIDQLEIDPAPVSAKALVDAAISLAETDVDLLDLDLPEDETVSVDQARVLQALVNMLGNAQRYGDGRTALVGRYRSATVVFEVHDDGPGVDERYERIVWERFERGNHHLDSHIPGSGIGLSVVRGIARAHGGEAGYRRSERLGGACFWISLPADATHQPRALLVSS